MTARVGVSVVVNVMLEQWEAGVAPGLGPISLSVNQGEVLGVAGLMGAGRSRLLHTIFGAIASTDGEMTLAGSRYAPRTPAFASSASWALLRPKVSATSWYSRFR